MSCVSGIRPTGEPHPRQVADIRHLSTAPITDDRNNQPSCLTIDQRRFAKSTPAAFGDHLNRLPHRAELSRKLRISRIVERDPVTTGSRSRGRNLRDKHETPPPLRRWSTGLCPTNFHFIINGQSPLVLVQRPGNHRQQGRWGFVAE
jgi:hypothetical protein